MSNAQSCFQVVITNEPYPRQVDTYEDEPGNERPNEEGVNHVLSKGQKEGG
mgnify:CR=1 FL=1